MAQEQPIPMCQKTEKKKKNVWDLCKKKQETQEDYKDFMRLCWKKIRRAKAQLELSLATII